MQNMEIQKGPRFSYFMEIQERLKSIGLFGSVGPYTKESVEGVNKPLKILWSISNQLFFLVKFQNRLMAKKARRDPLKLFNVFPESYFQDGIGSAYDVTLPKNWKIPLFQIKSKIVLWHAEDDCLVGNMTKFGDTPLNNSIGIHAVFLSGLLRILISVFHK